MMRIEGQEALGETLKRDWKKKPLVFFKDFP